jgi:hypothetical protein
MNFPGHPVRCVLFFAIAEVVKGEGGLVVVFKDGFAAARIDRFKMRL